MKRNWGNSRLESDAYSQLVMGGVRLLASWALAHKMKNTTAPGFLAVTTFFLPR